jgi:hypothetical protein
MDVALQGNLLALENEVRATALSVDMQQTALWALGQLPVLYVKFGHSNESVRRRDHPTHPRRAEGVGRE